MSQIFAYEWASGGGLLDGPEDGRLLSEGRAMLVTLISDLLDVRGTRVVTQITDNLALSGSKKLSVSYVASAGEEKSVFEQLASESDWTIVIAPECGGELLRRCQTVERVGGRLLGGSIATIELCSDKHATAEHLTERGVPTPTGIALSPQASVPRDFPLPLVIKPRDGAGSYGVGVIRSPIERDVLRINAPVRVETYHSGQAASVAVLCGRDLNVPLPACRQHIEHGLELFYAGGSLPLPPDLEDRAVSLAIQAISTLENTFGWFGVDLMLGDNPDGSGDVVIEINPRLTTSYVGLSAACKTNLAEALLAIADRRRPAISFNSEAWVFDNAGNVQQVFNRRSDSI